MINFRNFVREFVLRYTQENGSEIISSNKMGYIRSLKPSFSFNDWNVNIFEDPMFIDKKDGSTPLLDIQFARKQRSEAVVKHHNILTRK